MRALILCLTLLGTFGLQPVNAGEGKTDVIYQATENSADTYCSAKDNKVNEEKALAMAYYNFTKELANEFDTTPIVVHEGLTDKQVNKFWDVFNVHAYDECPEYY